MFEHFFTKFLKYFTECPGLAEWDTATGMEVKNPLFSEDTPAAKTDKAPSGVGKAAK